MILNRCRAGTEKKVLAAWRLQRSLGYRAVRVEVEPSQVQVGTRCEDLPVYFCRGGAQTRFSPRAFPRRHGQIQRMNARPREHPKRAEFRVRSLQTDPRA